MVSGPIETPLSESILSSDIVLPNAAALPPTQEPLLDSARENLDLSGLSLPPLRGDFETPIFDGTVGEDSQELFEAVEKAVGEGAGISWHYTEPETISDPIRFARSVEPFIVPGRTDVTTFQFFGGLSATGYPWMDFAMKIYDRSAFQCEVYPLAGHSGQWSDLRDTDQEKWIADIYEKSLHCKTPPIAICYSTSLPIVFEIERRHPGTYRAIIGVGGPFKLANDRLEHQIDVGQRIHNIFRALGLGFVSPLRFGAVPMKHRDLEHKTKYDRKSPHYSKLPLYTTMSLRKIQLLGRDAAKHITVPFFYGQGELDSIVDPSVPKFLEETVRSQHKVFKMYENSDHGPMLGHERYKLLRDICDFLHSVFKDEPEDRNLPDFKTRISKAAAHTLGAKLVEAVVRSKEGSLENTARAEAA